MRLLTFCFLKNCRLKFVKLEVFKRFKSEYVESIKPQVSERETFIEILPSWPENEERSLREQVLRDMQVIPDFVTEDEEKLLITELDPHFKKMRYEFDHWDNAIEGYREMERTNWREENQPVINRLRETALKAAAAPNTQLLPHEHVLDLAASGHIKPHVDAVRFCGEVIAGLCMLSPAVMRLRHERRPLLALDALLPRRGLYLMRGVARYAFSHEVLGGAASAWRGRSLHKARRVAIICRSEPLAHSTHSTHSTH